MESKYWAVKRLLDAEDGGEDVNVKELLPARVFWQSRLVGVILFAVAVGIAVIRGHDLRYALAAGAIGAGAVGAVLLHPKFERSLPYGVQMDYDDDLGSVGRGFVRIIVGTLAAGFLLVAIAIPSAIVAVIAASAAAAVGYSVGAGLDITIAIAIGGGVAAAVTPELSIDGDATPGIQQSAVQEYLQRTAPEQTQPTDSDTAPSETPEEDSADSQELAERAESTASPTQSTSAEPPGEATGTTQTDTSPTASSAGATQSNGGATGAEPSRSQQGAATERSPTDSQPAETTGVGTQEATPEQSRPSSHSQASTAHTATTTWNPQRFRTAHRQAETLRTTAHEQLAREAKQLEAETADSIQSRKYDEADASLAELRSVLDSFHRLHEDDRAESPILKDIETLAARIEAGRADSRVVGLLGSVGSAHSQAKQAIGIGAEQDAIERLESALDSLSKAEALNTEYDLGRGERIQSKRETLTELKRQVSADQADERVIGLIGSAGGEISRARDHIQERAFDQASTRLESASETLSEAAALNDEHDLGREQSIEDKRDELEELLEAAETGDSLLSTLKQHRCNAAEALENGNRDTAETELAELNAALETAGDDQAIDLEEFQNDAAELEARLAAEKADSRVVGLLGSVGSAVARADNYVEDSEFDKASKTLESALESLAEAAALDDEHDLGRAETIESRRADIEQQLEEVKEGPKERLGEVLNEAEAAVSQGVEYREMNDLPGAVDAFETANERYQTALRLTQDYDLPQRWEVEERQSMVSEYLEITSDELDERRQSVQMDIKETLSEAEQALTRAEQYEEVDDLVAARETLAQAVNLIDDVARLLETDVAPDDLREDYEQQLRHAEQLHQSLPDEEETGAYGNQELVESLQQLATKIGESPRPDFVNNYGEYPADAYLDVFGSWPEALAAANLDDIDQDAHERRKYTRVEVLDAVADLADELGHPPSKVEMNDQGAMSASPVTSRFADWETAIDLAMSGGPERKEQEQQDEPEQQQTEAAAEAPATPPEPTPDASQDGDSPKDTIDRLMNDLFPERQES